MPATHSSRRRRRLPIAATLFALIPCIAAGQQPPRQPADSDEVLRVTTEIVQTDVAVFDKGGKFVDNLRPDQFVLKVDGRPQPISFFEKVVAGGLNEDAQIAAARGRPRGPGSASGPAALPLDRGRALVFFLDDFHLSPRSLARTRELLRHFIDARLGQNDQMAIVTASNQLGFLSQLTDDRRVLREAAARLVARPSAEVVDRERPQMNVAQALAVVRREQSLIDAFVAETMREQPGLTEDQARQEVEQRAGQLVDLTSAVVLRTFDGLRGALQTFAPYPGRKLFYFLSDGFALDLQRNNTGDRLRAVTDAAVRSGAVIYTLDARGLGAQLEDMPSAADESSPMRFNGLGTNVTATTQEPLRAIAGETGGRAILNTDSFDSAVERALKETSVYYLLAWRPEREENRGGSFRRVEVSVRDRPDLSVLVQRGLYGSPPDASRGGRKGGAASPAAEGASAQTPEKERAGELLAALRSPFPRAELPTAVTLNYAKAQDDTVTLLISVMVELEAGGPAAGTGADRAQVLGAVYDAHGKPVATFERAVSVVPDGATAKAADANEAGADAAASAKTLRLSLAFQSQVAPGLYQVRFASLDARSRRAGSAAQWIEVPDLTGKGFSVSSVFLGVRPAAAPPAEGADKRAAPAGPQVLVVPERRFPRDSSVRFLLYTYNAAAGAGGRPDVAVQVQVFRDDQPVITAPLRKVNSDTFADFSRLPYAAELSLAGLPAGRYLLRVTAIDRVARASAAQEVRLTIN
jgi:VWFA-related protein